ncbi:MAG: SMP-30/gluconolactonase/LRE family protein [Bacteroidales bacterium]|jgi:sugar lactone lactonase YvrE|nr:SMP-30/gluconolactonase/LRE family protein [Bacteroidales bacterium]
MKIIHKLLFILMGIFTYSCAEKSLPIELVIDAQAAVGEGALWDAPTQRLFWIDIAGKMLHVYAPQLQKMDSYPMPEEIATVVVIDSSHVLLALARGIYEFNLETQELIERLRPEIDVERVRFNDGKCSPQGELWVGTMDKETTKPIAALYRISGDFAIEEKRTNVTVSNGLCWSPDGLTFYYIDSPTYSIMAFVYNAEKRSISRGERIIDTPKEWGTPDGCTIDERGMIWVAHWGGAKVSCWNPYTRKLMQSIDVPSPNVTSVAFGGENLDELYITTARNWQPEGSDKKFPHAGGLFMAKPGVKGIESYRFVPTPIESAIVVP